MFLECGEVSMPILSGEDGRWGRRKQERTSAENSPEGNWVRKQHRNKMSCTRAGSTASLGRIAHGHGWSKYHYTEMPTAVESNKKKNEVVGGTRSTCSQVSTRESRIVKTHRLYSSADETDA